MSGGRDGGGDGGEGGEGRTLEALRQRWPVVGMDVDGAAVEAVRTPGVVGHRPIVFLPGAQGTAESFYKQLLAWGGRRELVAVGYPARTDAAALADWVVALADALEADRIDLVGSSLGGYVAQWVALRHPERIGRLVLGNTFCDPAPSQSPDKLRAVESGTADELKRAAVARLEASPASELRSVQLDLVGLRQPADLLRARMLTVQLAAPVAAAPVDRENVLVLECDDDPLVAPPMRASLRAAYAGSATAILPAGGHYPYIAAADAYDAAVGPFLGLDG